MPNSELVQRIRTIFLHPWPYVSLGEAAWILGWTSEEMERAIVTRDIEVTATCSGREIAIEEVLAKARALWPVEVIEEALGAEAARVLPPGLRALPVTLRLPSYQAAMLEHLARRQQTTIGHLLWFQLDELASEHLDELSAAIPGFEEAFGWPHAAAEEPMQMAGVRGLGSD
jgi:hypothetical protein